MLLSALAHVAVVALVPWSGSALLAPPIPQRAALQWAEVSTVAAMPGTGDDLLTGPSEAMTPAAPSPPVAAPVPVVEGVAPGAPIATPPEEDAAAVRAELLREILVAEVLRDRGDRTEASEAGSPGRWVGAGGRFGTIQDAELALWQREIQVELMEHFAPLPATFVDQPGLAAWVGLELGPDGAILERVVLESSGSASFDAAALRAVDELEAVPPPPEGWWEVISRDGVAVRFLPP